MSEIKKVLICGLGAIGSIYADKIQSYDPDSLRILVDAERFERYSQSPTIFNGRELNFNYVLPSETNFKADLIIIATKFEGFLDAVNNIRNFISDNTVILSLLNGVTSESILASKYGKDKILYSYFIGHSAVREGRKITHDDVNTIVYGSENSLDNDNIERVRKYFEKVGINYKIPDDIIHALWLKYMLNVAGNQITAILRFTFGELTGNTKAMYLVRESLKEVENIARAEGVRNSENLIEETVEHLYTMIPEGKTSMLQDVEAGRKTEVDIFASTVIELGKKHGIQTPYNKVFKEMLDAIYEKGVKS